MKEAELLRLVMDWLAAERIFAIRMNTGAVHVAKRFIRFGVPGMADVLAFCPNDFGIVWIECKVGRNGQSDLQKSFQKQVEREGHKYILAYDLESVQAHFL